MFLTLNHICPNNLPKLKFLTWFSKKKKKKKRRKKKKIDSNVLFFPICNLERKKNLIFLPVVSVYNMLILLNIFSFFWLRKWKMISAWRADKIQWSFFQFQSSNTYFSFLFMIKLINGDMCISRLGRLMHFFQ